MNATDTRQLIIDAISRAMNNVETMEDPRAVADAALAALSQAHLLIVPRKPTEAMITDEDALCWLNPRTKEFHKNELRRIWCAMLAAYEEVIER